MKRLAITGISAMQAWDGGARPYARPSRITSPASFAQTGEELAGFSLLPRGCTEPVEILVASDNHRVRSARWRACRRGKPLPSGMLWDIGESRLLVSPGYFFLRTAPRLSLVQAVLLGMELCGGYSTLMSIPYRDFRDAYIREERLPLDAKVWPPSSWDLSLQHQRDLMDNGFVVRESLMRVPELATCVGRGLSARSNSRAKTAAALVRGDSLSPMESRLYARYCLPRRYGGMNLNPVELNAAIPLTDELYAATGIRCYSVDLLWRDGGIAIEYQGRHAHAGADAEARDRLKRNILDATGIRIISIDRKQNASEDMLELYGREIAKALHVRPGLLELSPSERSARYRLVDELSSWDFDLYRP